MRSLSYSQLASAHRCNKLYEYQTILKIKNDQPPSGDMAFGTGIHLGVESILTGSGDGISDFNLFWNLEKSRNNKYGRLNHEQLQNNAEVLLSRFTRLHASKFQVHQMEQRLFSEIGRFKVEGTPDFLGLFDGIPSVVDFKTSGSRYHKDKIIVAEQLYMYTHLAMTKLNYLPEQLVYVVFIKGSRPDIQIVKRKFDKMEYIDAMLNIERMCSELVYKESINTFTMNKNSCIMGEMKCPYFNNCYGAKNE